ncbi:hypothetical protein ABZ468_25725 [Streptomyces sp. NPDC005708]|uniref:hypothetical protein n=1 Tax=Streptomyces sp. NPDC005708 TaxID=3154564 RepID=UPI0033EBE5EE
MLNFTRGGPTAKELQLTAENRDLRDQLAAATERLVELQAANEGHYRQQYDATGGPRFDKGQPFGSEPKRKIGTLWLKGGTS